MNTIEKIVLKKNSFLSNIFVNNSKSNGYFYKYIKNDLEKNSNLENYLLSSGLKFNKFDIEINLNEEYSKVAFFLL